MCAHLKHQHYAALSPVLSYSFSFPLSSRPKQPAFSCARFLSAGCVAEGPWLDFNQRLTDGIITLHPLRQQIF